jgi:hypothetical protein
LAIFLRPWGVGCPAARWTRIGTLFWHLIRRRNLVRRRSG